MFIFLNGGIIVCKIVAIKINFYLPMFDSYLFLKFFLPVNQNFEIACLENKKIKRSKT